MESSTVEVAINGPSCKEASLYSSSSFQPNSSTHHDHTHSAKVSTHGDDINNINLDHTHNANDDVHVDATSTLQNIPFNPFNSPHIQDNEGSCTLGSPGLLLPTNACIDLDDNPSSTSYSSPSDTTSIWPPHESPMLDFPYLYLSGGPSHHENRVYCNQIPMSQFDGFSKVDISNNVDIPHYTTMMVGHCQNSSYVQHPNILDGFHYMMQGSNNPYYSRSNPYGTSCSSSSSHYSLPHNATREAIDHDMMDRAPYPHNVDGCVRMLHHNITTSNEQKQHWQQDKEDYVDHLENEAMEPIKNMVMIPDHHHQLVHDGIHMAHSSMAMMDSQNLHQSMGNPNARSPKHQQKMSLTSFQGRCEVIDMEFSHCIEPSENHPNPDGEGGGSWLHVASCACSPPLKMTKSPSLSKTTTRPGGLYIPIANPSYTNGYNVNEKLSNDSAALSPPTPNPVIVSPSASPPNQLERRPTKASTRQSACNNPQSVAARQRRERISERLKALQELVPNGSKVDLVTMLEKAINYVKSLQLQVKVLSTDEYWPTPLFDNHSFNNLDVVAKIAASTYS